MNVSLVYYRDIPLKKDEYSLKIGNLIIETFEKMEDVDSITLVPMDKFNYKSWLKGRFDTSDLRAEWSIFKTTLLKSKHKELAKYLGVSVQAVKQYPKDKLKLMLYGLSYINKDI